MQLSDPILVSWLKQNDCIIAHSEILKDLSTVYIIDGIYTAVDNKYVMSLTEIYNNDYLAYLNDERYPDIFLLRKLDRAIWRLKHVMESIT